MVDIEKNIKNMLNLLQNDNKLSFVLLFMKNLYNTGRNFTKLKIKGVKNGEIFIK